jgi:predicted phage gp36 major capsid-like protein
MNEFLQFRRLWYRINSLYAEQRDKYRSFLQECKLEQQQQKRTDSAQTTADCHRNAENDNKDVSVDISNNCNENGLPTSNQSDDCDDNNNSINNNNDNNNNSTTNYDNGKNRLFLGIMFQIHGRTGKNNKDFER